MFRDPVKLSIGQLFKLPKLRIPIYQRGYAWEADHIEAYIGDVQDLWRRSDHSEAIHFIGTMLCRRLKSELYGEEVEVIDGQQRLTTTSLLMLAIRNAALRLSESEQVPAALSAELEQSAARMDEQLYAHVEGTDVRVQKLTLNTQDNQEWIKLLVDGEITRKHLRGALAESSIRILEAYEALEDELVSVLVDASTPEAARASAAVLMKRFEQLVDGLVLILVEAETEDDVFELFMVINDRGKPLSAVDLIRTAALSKVKKQKDLFEECDSQFEELLQVEDDLCRKVLVHYVNSLTGVRISKTATLKTLRKLLFESSGKACSPGTIVDNVRDMSESARFLLAIGGETNDSADEYPFTDDSLRSQAGLKRQRRLIEALRNESCKPLLVAARRKFAGEESKPQAYLDLLYVVERITIRAFVCRNIHNSKLADFYIQQAHRMAQIKGWTVENLWEDACSDAVTKGRVVLGLRRWCDDNVFRDALRNLRLSPGNRGLLTHILLSITEFNYGLGLPALADTKHLSDVLLDRIEGKDKDNEVFKDATFRDSLGNLTVLAGKGLTNKKLNGMEYVEKRTAVYLKDPNAWTRSLAKEHEYWDIDAAEENLSAIVEHAMKVWSLSPKLWGK